MTTTTILTAALAIYILLAIATFRICAPDEHKMDPYDQFLVPLLSLLWPLAWGFVLFNEVLGFLKSKYAASMRRKRLEKKRMHNFKNKHHV